MIAAHLKSHFVAGHDGLANDISETEINRRSILTAGRYEAKRRSG
jgi:hypothetical protein